VSGRPGSTVTGVPSSGAPLRDTASDPQVQTIPVRSWRTRNPGRGSNSITASTGPPAADSRRTSSVAGSSRPLTSATIASVSVRVGVSGPSPTCQVVSSVAVCRR
jgi:hypothetical protein